ncbi:hypothetical protein D3C76_1416160 [compost metagenome]
MMLFFGVLPGDFCLIHKAAPARHLVAEVEEQSCFGNMLGTAGPAACKLQLAVASQQADGKNRVFRRCCASE